jgi:hypothetical protein
MALLLVGGFVAPLWQYVGGVESREQLAARWTPQRLTQLFLGPEQVACYVCFVWAALILQSRYREVIRQRAAHPETHQFVDGIAPHAGVLGGK